MVGFDLFFDLNITFYFTIPLNRSKTYFIKQDFFYVEFILFRVFQLVSVFMLVFSWCHKTGNNVDPLVKSDVAFTSLKSCNRRHGYNVTPRHAAYWTLVTYDLYTHV